MARTFRRNTDFARRHITLRDDWARADAAIGRPTYTSGPRQTNGWTEWELVTDNFGSDSNKKKSPIKRHRRSIRRFVSNTLAQGMEPIVANDDRTNWYYWDGAYGIAVPVEPNTDDTLFGTPDEDDDDPICPPNTACGCGEALATVAIAFSESDTRFYCYPCS